MGLKMKLFSVAAALSVFFLATFVRAQDFEDIDNVPQDVNEVYLPANCPKFGRVSKVMYTFEPTTTASGGGTNNDTKKKVRIATFPANLVKAVQRNDNELRLELNVDVAYSAKEGGVRMYFPPDQLSGVSVAADAVAQIMDGFTKIRLLSASSDSVLYATMTTALDNSTSSSTTDGNGDNKLSLKVSSDARATVVSSNPFDTVSVSSDAELELDAPLVDTIKVSSDARLTMRGDANYATVSSDGEVVLDGSIDSAKITSDAEVTVYGKVTGNVDVRSDGKLLVGDEIADSATIDAASDAEVYAPSCDRVATRSSARCVVDDSISGKVDVTVPSQPYTMMGTHKCGNFSFFSFAHQQPWSWCTWMAIPVVVAIAGLCSCWQCKRRQRRLNAQQQGHLYPAAAAAPAMPAVADEEKIVPEAVAVKVENNNGLPEEQQKLSSQLQEAVVYDVNPTNNVGDSKV